MSPREGKEGMGEGAPRRFGSWKVMEGGSWREIASEEEATHEGLLSHQRLAPGRDVVQPRAKLGYMIGFVC